MKILMVSWEYPPVVVGGLGRHVHQLAVALATQGHDVTVLTRTNATDGGVAVTSAEGVRVVAVSEDPPEFSFGADMMAWVMALGHSLIRGALHEYREGAFPQPDVVHAHDWLVAHAAIGVADFFDVPIVTTLHATEAGRHSGWLSGTINRQVHSVEWWLANSSDEIITCSASMADEVRRLFGPELATVHTINNGIDITTWDFAERAVTTQPPRLLYAGRLEYEKGIQDAIAALALLRRTHPGTTLTVAGDGTQREWLQQIARDKRVLRAVTFTGRIGHDALLRLLHQCSAIVLPSRYEPFGIVALEAAAAGAPLVVTNAGGLAEAVEDGVTGLVVPIADPTAIAWAVGSIVDHPAAAAERARAARARLTERFSWDHIATRTVAVYAAARRRPRKPLQRPEIPQRPLPERDVH